jgi:hypothetical protein
MKNMSPFFLAILSLALVACNKQFDSNLPKDPDVFFNPSKVLATYTGGWKSTYTGSYWNADGASHDFGGMSGAQEWARITYIEDGNVQVTSGEKLWNCDEYNSPLIFKLDELYLGINGACSPNDDLSYDYSIELRGLENDSLVVQVIVDSREGDGVEYERLKVETKNYILLKER